MGHLHGLEGLGQGADLVDLDQQGVGGAELDALGEALGVGDEEVVADDLDLVADLLGEVLPVVPLVLGERVLDGDDREVGDELLVVLDHRGGVLGLALELVGLGLVVKELRGGDVHGQGDVLAGLVAGLLDGLDDELEGLAVGVEVGGEAALVAQAGGQAALLHDRLEGVVDLGAHAQGLTEGGGADGGDHELLDVHVGVGVGAAVEDVHHGHGQDVGVGAADVLEQVQAGGLGGGLGGGQGDAEDGVGAELALVGGAVELDHELVETALVGGVEADDLGGDDVVDVVDGLLHSLAAVTALVAVAQLNGLEGTGGGARGDGGASGSTVLQEDLDLEGRVATGVEDLAGVNVLDEGHLVLLAEGIVMRSSASGTLARDCRMQDQPSGPTPPPRGPWS